MFKNAIDTIEFICFYILGAIIFFSHTSILVSKSVIKIGEVYHLSENEKLELHGKYFLKIVFQSLLMCELPVMFGIYIVCNEKFAKNVFVTSGLYTVVWLVISGFLINHSYNVCICKIKKLFNYDFEKCLENKEFLWVMCMLLYAILFSFYDSKIFLIVLSMVLGKYIWMDFSQNFSIRDVKVVRFLKERKIEVLLLLCQASVIGYLVLRWHSVRNQEITRERFLEIILNLTFLLMPIVDLLIWNSMNFCAKDIVRDRT